LSHITQQHDRVQYWIPLYKALGGGWQTTSAVNKETGVEAKEKSVSLSQFTMNKPSPESTSPESTK